MPLDVLVEGLLFYKATPQKISTLQKLFDVSEADWKTGIEKLRARLSEGALRVVETDTHIQLVTAPELSDFIEAMRKDELSGDIGKAGAETLAIILYQGPIIRAEVDRIRGVNSSFILRNLLVRGLIERKAKGNTYEFSITPALLQHLGKTRKEDLPGFGEFSEALEKFVAIKEL
jgi:segregation and condensation protein B